MKLIRAGTTKRITVILLVVPDTSKLDYGLLQKVVMAEHDTCTYLSSIPLYLIHKTKLYMPFSSFISAYKGK